MQIKTELKTYRIDYLCEECATPVETYNHIFGTRWEHKCPKCGAKCVLSKAYPYIVYEDTDNITDITNYN